MNNKLHNIFLIVWLIVLLSLLNACVVVGQQKGSDSEIARVNVDLATEYYRQGRLDYALENLKKAIRAEPESVDANTLIALVYSQIDKIALAREHFEAAAEHVSSDSNKYGQVHNNFGAFLCAHEQYLEAQEHFELAFENKLYKTPEAAYENAGLCALNRPDVVKARLYFDQALKINPNLPQALIETATLDFKEKKFAEAQLVLLHFHKVNKVVSRSLWLASQIEMSLDNKNKAQKLLAQLKRDFPDSIEAKGNSLVLDK